MTRLLRGAALSGLLLMLLIGGASAAPALAPLDKTSPSPTVWLCRPGARSDPCTFDLSTTVVAANGARSVENPSPAASAPDDCFYVYPTVSLEAGQNADLKIQPAETKVAISQASQFSTVCRVWAPMYRQRTVSGLFSGLSSYLAASNVAYQSLLSGWKDYLAHDNDGRPIIFIGHSQGAAILIQLLRSQVDNNAALRRRLVAAVILGGNVQVPTGKLVGGSFQHIPACTSASDSGCVIAYSSFLFAPPSDSLFGIPGAGVSLQSGQSKSRGQQVLCVNPSGLGAGTAALLPDFPASTSAPPGPAVKTPWVQFPNLYTARCKSSGGATWLQITDVAGPSDHRPIVTQALGPTWGTHADDVNLALGNLVGDVAQMEASYSAHAH